MRDASMSQPSARRNLQGVLPSWELAHLSLPCVAALYTTAIIHFPSSPPVHESVGGAGEVARAERSEAAAFEAPSGEARSKAWLVTPATGQAEREMLCTCQPCDARRRTVDNRNPNEWPSGLRLSRQEAPRGRAISFFENLETLTIPQKALCGGIPSSFLEPSPRSWSHFVGVYRQILTTSLKK